MFLMRNKYYLRIIKIPSYHELWVTQYNVNPIALRTAKTLQSFGRSEWNRVEFPGCICEK